MLLKSSRGWCVHTMLRVPCCVCCAACCVRWCLMRFSLRIVRCKYAHKAKDILEATLFSRPINLKYFDGLLEPCGKRKKKHSAQNSTFWYSFLLFLSHHKQIWPIPSLSSLPSLLPSRAPPV
jgi:hypothetical protein